MLDEYVDNINDNPQVEVDASSKSLVFLYGTLMTGGTNNRQVSEGGISLGPALLKGYKLLDLGAYPGLVGSDESDYAYGELWEIDTDELPYLDYFEGTPYLYNRIQCTVEYREGVDTSKTIDGVFTYLYTRGLGSTTTKRSTAAQVRVVPDYQDETQIYYWMHEVPVQQCEELLCGC